MNDPHDNAQDDRDALTKHALEAGLDLLTGQAAEKYDPTTGEVPFEPDETPDRGWDPVTRSLTSMDGAAWAARKYREMEDQLDFNRRAQEAEAAFIQAECDRKMAASEARTQAADKPFEKGLAFFESLLTVYATNNRAEMLRGLKKDAKSRLFPSGVRIGWRKDGGGYRWDDALPAAERQRRLAEWASQEESGAGLEEMELRKVLAPVADLEAIRTYLAERVQDGRDEGPTAPPGLKYVEPAETLEIVVKGKP